MGVSLSTLARTGRRSAFVKMPAQPGSLREWVRPASPSVSYAVAIVVEILPQACCINCQVGLDTDVDESGSRKDEKIETYLVAA